MCTGDSWKQYLIRRNMTPQQCKYFKMDRFVVCCQVSCQMNSNVKSDIIWELSNAADFSGAFLSTVSLKSRISSQSCKSLFVCSNIRMIWKYITSSLLSMQKVFRYLAFFVQKLTLFCKHNNKSTSISRKDRHKTLNIYQ